jgi:hypothetical protein
MGEMMREGKAGPWDEGEGRAEIPKPVEIALVRWPAKRIRRMGRR